MTEMMRYPPTVVLELTRERHQRLVSEAARQRLAATVNHPTAAGRLRQGIGRQIVALGMRIQSSSAAPVTIEEPC